LTVTSHHFIFELGQDKISFTYGGLETTSKTWKKLTSTKKAKKPPKFAKPSKTSGINSPHLTREDDQYLKKKAKTWKMVIEVEKEKVVEPEVEKGAVDMEVEQEFLQEEVAGIGGEAEGMDIEP